MDFGWLDDRVVPRDALLVPADDPGLLVGDGLFETMLVRDGRVRSLAAHLARFEAARLALALPDPPADPARAIGELLGANLPLPPELGLRLTLTARPTLVIMAWELGQRELTRRRGLALHTLPARRGEQFLARYKSLAWTANAVQRRLHPAGADAAFEGLWLDPGDMVLEGTSTNIFAVMDGAVFTAPVSAPILPGTSRAAVVTALRARGHEVHEALFGRADLERADEIFATNALLPLAAITSLDGRPCREGPVVDELRRTTLD